MTDTIIVALISSAATLLAVYLKLKLDKKKDKREIKEARVLLEDLSAKRATIILKEDGTEFNFESKGSLGDLIKALSGDDKKKAELYNNIFEKIIK